MAWSTHFREKRCFSSEVAWSCQIVARSHQTIAWSQNSSLGSKTGGEECLKTKKSSLEAIWDGLKHPEVGQNWYKALNLELEWGECELEGGERERNLGNHLLEAWRDGSTFETSRVHPTILVSIYSSCKQPWKWIAKPLLLGFDVTS